MFSEEDFKRAFELEMGREKEGWRLVLANQQDRIEVWEMVDYNADVPLHFKSTGRLEGVPLKKCFDLLTIPEKRNQWDEGFFHLEKLSTAELDSDSTVELLYWTIQMPCPVRNRDMVQFSTNKWIPEENALVILYKQGDAAIKPVSRRKVRMRTGLSYTILRQAEDDKNSTLISTLGNNDYGGWIPDWIVSYVYSKTLPSLYQRLQKGYKELNS
jgi:hypothetical protein